MAIGLSAGYETWPPNGWHHPFVIRWFNMDWDCLMPHCIIGSCDQWEFPPFFRPQWQSLCTALTAGKCLPLGLCKGTVKESRLLPWAPPSPHLQRPDWHLWHVTADDLRPLAKPCRILQCLKQGSRPPGCCWLTHWPLRYLAVILNGKFSKPQLGDWFPMRSYGFMMSLDQRQAISRANTDRISIYQVP